MGHGDASLEPVVPKLTKAVEPIVLPVQSGAVKVLPRWAEEDSVQRWRVRYRVMETEEDRVEDVEKSWTELELRPFTRDLPLTGLRHGLVHFFLVAIQTKDGWSDWSRVVRCTPPSPELPAQPAAVFALVVDETTACVRWTRPIDHASNHGVLRYTLRYTWTAGKHESQEDCFKDIEIVEDCEDCLVGGLRCCRDYRFQLAAENCSGWGEFSNPSAELRMPLPVPLAPPAPALRRATHHSAVIQWQHPLVDSPIQSFCFRYIKQGGHWEKDADVTEIHKVHAGLSQYVVEGLATGSTYVFQVRAVNEFGLGIWSDDSIPISTLQGREPAKIQELTVPNIYRSFVTLQWRPADHNGFDVEGNVIRASNQADMSDAVEIEPRISRLNGFDRCDLRHLQKLTYYFQVAAFNKVGLSDWSDAVQVALAPLPALYNKTPQAALANATQPALRN